MNLAEIVLRGLGDDPSKPVLMCDGKEVSREKFIHEVCRRQVVFEQYNVDKGDTVLVPCGRGANYWADFVALWGLGAVPVPLEEKPTPDYARAVMAKADPGFIVEPGRQMQDLFPDLVNVLMDESPASCPATPEIRPVDFDDEAVVIFTSGSTGTPKGVSLSHGAVAKNMQSVMDILDIQSTDRVFVAVPFRFASAICHFLAVTASGAVFVGMEATLLMGDYISSLKTMAATAVGGSPVQMRWIAEAAGREEFSLRWLMSSGDHLPNEVIDLLRKNLPGTMLYNVYGLTEVGGRFCIRNPHDREAEPSSVGKPLSCLNIKIIDDDGQFVESGVEGYIYASGEALMLGYRNDPAKTDESMGPHGFKTGDLGYLDEHGDVHVTGRADDVFKSAGRKVSSLPIAACMMETGVFDDVAVWPCKHPVVGNVPVAFYVLKKEAAFVRRDILRKLRSSLPANHIPYLFKEIEKIPRTGSGKLDRKTMKIVALREVSF